MQNDNNAKVKLKIFNKKMEKLLNHDEKDYDTIPYRLELIKTLLDNKEVKPLFDPSDSSTENFINDGDWKVDHLYKSDSIWEQYKLYHSEPNDNNLNSCHVLGKKTVDFGKTMMDIGGELIYKKSGSSGHTFRAKIKIGDKNNEQSIKYAVKVVPYLKNDIYGKIDDVRRPENSELLMIKALSRFVVKGETQHIVLPITCFNSNIKPFLNIEPKFVGKSKKYIEFQKRYKKGQYCNVASILLSEWANAGDLLNFLKRRYLELDLTHWKVIFFQLLSVLAIIQNKYIKFRHNDLKANNILVHKINNKKKNVRYTINESVYIVPQVGYIIKLWDFDFACIPNKVDNFKVYAEWTDSINVRPIQNRYYDVHYFFNTLINFIPELTKNNLIPIEVKDFIKRVLPPKFRKEPFSNDKGRLMVNQEFVTPEKILKEDIFFSEYRRNKEGIK